MQGEEKKWELCTALQCRAYPRFLSPVPQNTVYRVKRMRDCEFYCMRKVFTRIDIIQCTYCTVLYSTILRIILTTMFQSFGKSQPFNVAFKTRYMVFNLGSSVVIVATNRENHPHRPQDTTTCYVPGVG